MKKRKRRTRKHRNSKKSYSEPKIKQQNHVAGCDRHPGGLSTWEGREENAVQGHPWLQSEFKASLAYSVYRKTKPEQTNIANSTKRWTFIRREKQYELSLLTSRFDITPWNLSFGVTPKCLLDKWINLGHPGSSIRLVMVSSSQWFGDTSHARAGSWELLSPCAQSDLCTKPHWCKVVLRDGDSETREVFKILLDHNLY